MAKEDVCGVTQSSPRKGFSSKNSHFSRPIYSLEMKFLVKNNPSSVEPHFGFSFQLTSCFYSNHLAKDQTRSRGNS